MGIVRVEMTFAKFKPHCKHKGNESGMHGKCYHEERLGIKCRSGRLCPALKHCKTLT